MSVLSAFGYLVAVKGLVVPGNAARTAKNVADHEGLFRFGILSLYLVAALDVVVAWALYRVFKPVNGALSKLAAWLRMAYAGVFIVAISQLVGALARAHPGAAAHQHLHQHLGRRARPLRSESVRSSPTWPTGRDMSRTCSVSCSPSRASAMCSTPPSGRWPEAPRPMSPRSRVIGEFVFALWLVIRGRRITLPLESHDGSIGAAR